MKRAAETAFAILLTMSATTRNTIPQVQRVKIISPSDLGNRQKTKTLREQEQEIEYFNEEHGRAAHDAEMV